MPLLPETVAIPVIKGVDLTTDARLVSSPSLLEALNTQLSGGGAKKRRGHVAVPVRGEGLVPTGDTGEAYTWGYGRSDVLDGSVLAGEEATLLGTSSDPRTSTLRGVLRRDSEAVVWDGFRMFSYSPSQEDAQDPFQSDVVGSAVLPSLRSFPTAKSNTRQSQPDMADTGRFRIVAWIDDTDPDDRAARYSLYDSVTDAPLVVGAELPTPEPLYMRCVALGDWLHIFSLDEDTLVVRLYSIHVNDPNEVTERSFGACSGGHFDIWKAQDTAGNPMAVLARSNGTVDVTFLGETGEGHADYYPQSLDPAGGVPITLVSCALWSGADTQQLGLAYKTATYVGFRAYELGGPPVPAAVAMAPQATVAAGSTAVRVSLSPKALLTSWGAARWDVYFDDGDDLRAVRAYPASGGASTTTGTERFRAHLGLASRAFSVGDRTFLWAGHRATLQSTWFLLDEALLPVGHCSFGVANVLETADVTGFVASVTWSADTRTSGTESEGGWPGFTCHLALSSKLRVAPPSDTDPTSTGIYTEPAIRATYLDFLPPLRSAQGGRATYIPGAQLWSYDGQAITEAGFHLGPEPSAPAASNGGALTLLGTYSYRVDLCHRNAQNEEVRSLSILTPSVELTGSQRTLTLTIPTCLTRRADAYLLIYRNAMEDGVPLVNWWLLNSRDPGDASFRGNDLTAGTVTYIDAGEVDDTEIQTREFHPASDTYLQPIAAPACEIISAGRDRVWVGGGELLPGEVAPSRLFAPGESPGFSPYLSIQVDRSAEPLTAIGFVGEIAAFFRRGATHIMDGDGPDNNAQGLWPPARLALADLGAVGQESLGLIAQGLAFQSPAGIRVLGPGGAVSAIGIPVDRVARDLEITGAVVVDADQEIRWYGADLTLVYNYIHDTWSTWTVTGTGVVLAPPSLGTGSLALVTRDDGELWIETPSVWQDGGANYTHRIRTGWMHGGQLGDFQRVRAAGALGRYADPENPAHTIRVEFSYDERDFWEERIQWDAPDSTTNSSTWGASSWGDGVWGDTNATLSNLEDLTWDWIRGPNRQKCSSVSVSVEDVETNGPGFVLAAFILELARKPGLNRLVHRDGTSTNRE